MKRIHRSASVLALGTLAALVTASPVLTPNAQAKPYDKWGKKKPVSRVYIPARGSSTRQGIADAMRRDVGKFAGVYVIFTFTYIKASGVWAYAEAQPSAPNGKSQYEPVNALLKKSGSGWRVVDRVAGEGDTNPTAALRQLKSRNPSAPRAIFPR